MAPELNDKDWPDYGAFAGGVLNNALEVVRAKNHDYAGAEAHPLWNFRNAAHFTGTTPRTVLLSRLIDKVSRLANATRQELAVDESPAKSVEDLIGYAVLIAYTYAVDEWESNPHRPTAPQEPHEPKRLGDMLMARARAEAMVKALTPAPPDLGAFLEARDILDAKPIPERSQEMKEFLAEQLHPTPEAKAKLAKVFEGPGFQRPSSEPLGS